ncbi:MAG: glycosyltransferase family 87 protein [Pseudomonadota bacterium]
MTNSTGIDPRKILRWLFSWQALSIYAIVFAIIIFGAKILFSFRPLFYADAELRLSDFYVFWAAAQIMQENGIIAAFDQSVLNAKLAPFFGAQNTAASDAGELGLFWLYPPTILPWIYPLGFTSPMVGLVLFLLASIAIWCVTVLRFFPRLSDASVFPVLFAPALFVTLSFEQNGAFSAFCLIGFIVALKENRSPWLIGLFACLLLFKPQLGVFMPLVLLLERNYRAFFAAAVLCMLYLSAVTAIWGLEYWDAFFEKQRFMAGIINEGHYARLSISVFGFLQIAGFSAQPALFVHLGFAVALLWIFWDVWRKADWNLRISLFIMATLLLPHYTLVYDMTASAFVFGLIFPYAHRFKFGPLAMLIFWTSPMFFNSAPNLFGLIELPLINLAMIGFIWYLTKADIRAAAPAANMQKG